MSDVIPIASFRTRLEAELAARLLEGAAVPYVMNSSEGMLHGPLAGGTTLLVRAEDVELAHEVLGSRDRMAPLHIIRVTTCTTREAAARVRRALARAGLAALSSEYTGTDKATRHAVYVASHHADRARRVVQRATIDV